MIPINQLRADRTFLLDGQPFKVVSYSHTKMGRGNATIKVKAKNLRIGALAEKTFVSGDSVDEAQVVKRKLQFLYQDGESVHFMDPATYEQIEIQRKVIGDEVKFLKSSELADIIFFDEEPLSIELPPKINLTVSEAPPAVKGNSATNVYKDVILENGMTVRTPLFIKTGDIVRVDTRTGEYIERV